MRRGVDIVLFFCFVLFVYPYSLFVCLYFLSLFSFVHLFCKLFVQCIYIYIFFSLIVDFVFCFICLFEFLCIFSLFICSEVICSVHIFIFHCLVYS